jgi:hypothetical protein
MVYRCGVRCLRGLLGCTCVILCIGPILLIFGIMELRSPNYRERDIDQYNDNVASWDHSDSVAMAASTMIVEGSPMTLSADRVVVNGNTEGVNLQATSVFWTQAVPFDNITLTNHTLIVTMLLNNVSTEILFVVPMKHVISNEVTCGGINKFQCSSYGIDDCPVGTSTYHTISTPRGSPSCNPGQTCGVCLSTWYLTRACLFVTRQGNVWAPSPRIGCKYPFSQQEFGSPVLPSTFDLRIMSSLDPSVALQDITKGRTEFGDSNWRQVRDGVGLVVVGSLLIIILMCLVSMSACHPQTRAMAKEYWGLSPLSPPPDPIMATKAPPIVVVGSLPMDTEMAPNNRAPTLAPMTIAAADPVL